MSCWRAKLGVEPAPETERLRAELLKLVPAEAAGAQKVPRREDDDVPERAAVLEGAARDRAKRRAELTGRPSIAVLSFAGADDEDGYRHLGDGLAEDIATELGRFRELDVIAPTAAFAYRRADVTPERAGAELGTAYVLEGHLRPLGEALRITVRPVKTATAHQLWAERYDCARAGIFDLQDEVIRRIVSTLVGQIEEARLEAAKRRAPGDLAAYDLWLRGWSALRRPDLTAIGQARQFSTRRWPGTRTSRAPTSGSPWRT